MSGHKQSKKPLLRGYIHQEAFFLALGACILLIAKSSNMISLAASIIYSVGLVLMFGISAIYHRRDWQPKSRALLKRLDHSAIFVLIASTATPLCLLALSYENGRQFLLIVWGYALAGILLSIFWIKAPKFFSAFLYVTMGWLAWPFMGDIGKSLGNGMSSLIIVGGMVYTLGAVFYAIKRPNLFPGTFGYHELFHVFTIIGAALHFIVIFRIIN